MVNSEAARFHSYYAHKVARDLCDVNPIPQFEFGDDDSSWTATINGRKIIHIGLQAFDKYPDGVLVCVSNNDWHTHIRYVTGHEEGHIIHTTDRAWTTALTNSLHYFVDYAVQRVTGQKMRLVKEEDYSKALEYLSDHYHVSFNVRSVQQFTHFIVNSIEDGRMERRMAAAFPGFKIDMRYCRAKSWAHSPMDMSLDVSKPSGKLIAILNQVLSLATTGLYQKGFLSTVTDPAIISQVDSLKPLIRNGVTARSCRKGLQYAEEINRQLPEHETQYKNPRNLCSGSVLQLNSQITAERRVGFYAFSLVEAEGLRFSYHHEALAWLRNQGFETVEYRQVEQENLPEAVEAFREAIQDYPLPSDGLVLLMDDIAYGAALGSTARFPRDSIAFKWSDETARTLLEAIEWSASRTGLINPVAVFRPVELEGTSVSRASVHNLSTVESLALGVGDEISVYKANMIIPQIAENFSRTGPQPPPACCPVCGAVTQIRDTGEVRTLHCPNPDCPAKQIKAFELFVSRYAMNVEGLSQATLEKFLDLGIIRRFADLFRLEAKRDRIICLEGFGEKSFRNLLEAAEKARHTSLARLVVALGIGGVGPATARLLTRHFKEDPLALSQASQEALTEVEGIGEITARSIRAFFEDPGKNQSFHELLAVLDLEKDRKETGPQTLRDLNFVITGSLNHFVNRDALKACIESLGGRVSGSVSQKTTALINNDNKSVSAKNQTAKKLGIPILTEDEFLLQYQINKES